MQRLPEAAEPQKHTGCGGLCCRACPIGALNLGWDLKMAFLCRFYAGTGVRGDAHLWYHPSWGGLFVSWETPALAHCLCLSAFLASPAPMFY